MPDRDKVEDVVRAHLIGQRQSNDAVRRLSEELASPLVDWAAESHKLEGEQTFEDIINLRDEGHEALAELVARKIVELIGQH